MQNVQKSQTELQGLFTEVIGNIECFNPIVNPVSEVVLIELSSEATSSLFVCFLKQNYLRGKVKVQELVFIQSQIKNTESNIFCQEILVFFTEPSELLFPFHKTSRFLAIHKQNHRRFLLITIYELLKSLANNLPNSALLLWVRPLLTPIVGLQPLHPEILNKTLQLLMSKFLIGIQIPLHLKSLIISFRNEQLPIHARHVFEEVAEQIHGLPHRNCGENQTLVAQFLLAVVSGDAVQGGAQVLDYRLVQGLVVDQQHLLIDRGAEHSVVVLVADLEDQWQGLNAYEFEDRGDIVQVVAVFYGLVWQFYVNLRSITPNTGNLNIKLPNSLNDLIRQFLRSNQVGFCFINNHNQCVSWHVFKGFINLQLWLYFFLIKLNEILCRAQILVILLLGNQLYRSPFRKLIFLQSLLHIILQIDDSVESRQRSRHSFIQHVNHSQVILFRLISFLSFLDQDDNHIKVIPQTLQSSWLDLENALLDSFFRCEAIAHSQKGEKDNQKLRRVKFQHYFFSIQQIQIYKFEHV